MGKKIKINIAVWIVCIALIGVAIVSIITLQIQINDKKEELLAAKAERDAIIARIEEIKYELSKPIDDEYIIKIARERLGYHLPGEVVYRFEDRNEE